MPEGKLFIVATPIGNLQDITLRALEVLGKVDIVVCEDTRVSSTLLKKHGIQNELIALNEFNEEQVAYSILKHLETKNVALISDAGTPLISDPGYRLVKNARQKGHQVIPVPGPSALIAALSVSGLPTDKFSFLGFLPKSPTKSEAILKPYQGLETTIALYESPHRVIKTITAVRTVFGDLEITIARELTKIYEEVTTKKASEFVAQFENTEPKGEIVILFSTKKLR